MLGHSNVGAKRIFCRPESQGNRDPGTGKPASTVGSRSSTSPTRRAGAAGPVSKTLDGFLEQLLSLDVVFELLRKAGKSAL